MAEDSLSFGHCSLSVTIDNIAFLLAEIIALSRLCIGFRYMYRTMRMLGRRIYRV